MCRMRLVHHRAGPLPAGGEVLQDVELAGPRAGGGVPAAPGPVVVEPVGPRALGELLVARLGPGELVLEHPHGLRTSRSPSGMPSTWAFTDVRIPHQDRGELSGVEDAPGHPLELGGVTRPDARRVAGPTSRRAARRPPARPAARRSRPRWRSRRGGERRCPSCASASSAAGTGTSRSAFDLAEQVPDGLAGGVGAHAAAQVGDPAELCADSRADEAVGVALVLPEVAEEARGGAAAQHLEEHLGRRRSPDRSPAIPGIPRMRKVWERPWLLDEHGPRVGRGPRPAAGLPGRGPSSPRRRLSSGGPERRRVHVADHHQLGGARGASARRGTGPGPPGGSSPPTPRCRRSSGRRGGRPRRACPKVLRGDHAGLVALLEQAHPPLVLDPEEVGGREGRVGGDVGEQLEQPGQVRGRGRSPRRRRRPCRRRRRGSRPGSPARRRAGRPCGSSCPRSPSPR